MDTLFVVTFLALAVLLGIVSLRRAFHRAFGDWPYIPRKPGFWITLAVAVIPFIAFPLQNPPPPKYSIDDFDLNPNPPKDVLGDSP